MCLQSVLSQGDKMCISPCGDGVYFYSGDTKGTLPWVLKESQLSIFLSLNKEKDLCFGSASRDLPQEFSLEDWPPFYQAISHSCPNQVR